MLGSVCKKSRTNDKTGRYRKSLFLSTYYHSQRLDLLSVFDCYSDTFFFLFKIIVKLPTGQ